MAIVGTSVIDFLGNVILGTGDEAEKITLPEAIERAHSSTMRYQWMTVAMHAAAGYAIGWGISVLLKQDEKTRISMIYGSGMRNISAGAVIAAAYFPGEVMFPVMIGTLFQQVLAACYGSLIKRLRNREKGCKK